MKKKNCSTKNRNDISHLQVTQKSTFYFFVKKDFQVMDIRLFGFCIPLGLQLFEIS